MHHFKNVSAHNRQVMQYTLLHESKKLTDTKKNLVEKFKVKNHWTDKYISHKLMWYSRRANYLSALATSLPEPNFQPDSKQAVNIWVSLKMNQHFVTKTLHGDINSLLQLLEKYFKTPAKRSSSKKSVPIHTSAKLSAEGENSMNKKQSQSDYILNFIKDHFNQLSINQIMRGIRKCGKSCDSNGVDYYLQKNFSIYKSKDIRQYLKNRIHDSLKNNQIDESVKLTDLLNTCKFDNNYCKFTENSITNLTKSDCSSVLNTLLKRKKNM